MKQRKRIPKNNEGCSGISHKPSKYTRILQPKLIPSMHVYMRTIYRFTQHRPSLKMFQCGVFETPPTCKIQQNLGSFLSCSPGTGYPTFWVSTILFLLKMTGKDKVMPIEHQEKYCKKVNDFQQLASNFQPSRSPGAGEEIQSAAHWGNETGKKALQQSHV